MNRFTAVGLLAEISTGTRIMALVENYGAARETTEGLAEASGGICRVRRTNGDWRVDHPSGGCIYIRPVNGIGYRGLDADVLYLDAGVEHGDQWHDAVHCIAASPRGEVVRA